MKTKTKELFKEGFMEVFCLSGKRIDKISEYKKAVTKNGPERIEVDSFLHSVGLVCCKEVRIAAVSRLVKLAESPLIEYVKKQGLSEERGEEIRIESYSWVEKIYKDSFQKFMYEVEKKDLLIPFYTEIAVGGRRVGELMNPFHSAWEKQIKAINDGLKNRFETKGNVIKYLRENGLLDIGHGGLEADRCYSVLKVERGAYVRKAYFDAFPKEVGGVITELKRMILVLEVLDDYIYNQKKEWLSYLKALVLAFSETDVDKLVLVWADAERAWMKVTTPIQIGHPLEFYEDAYRKAVAPEWNMILVDLDAKESIRHELTENMFKDFFNKFDKEKYKDIYNDSLNNLRKSQLYNGTQMLYYGSLLNGLAMAQVVPNDAVVSAEYGKKVFVYPKDLLRKERNESIKVFPNKMFEKSFGDEIMNSLYNDTESYLDSNDRDITGHEHGHSLFVTHDTEMLMNSTGSFKNIEEFKATVGGFMTFFYEDASEEKKRAWMRELTIRAVALMRRREDPDVVAYYCEGIIHLTALFETKTISFNGKKISVDLSIEKYDDLRNWYTDVYEDLAMHYLEKIDAGKFLHKYVVEISGKYYALNEKANDLLLWVYDFYKEFGNTIDESAKKEDYIKK